MSIEEFNESTLIYDKLITDYYLETLRVYKNKGILFKIKSKAPVYKNVLKDEVWCAVQLVLNRWLQWIIHQNEVSTEEMLSQISTACNTTYPLAYGLTKIDLADAFSCFVENINTRPIRLNRSTVLSKSESGWRITRD